MKRRFGCIGISLVFLNLVFNCCLLTAQASKLLVFGKQADQFLFGFMRINAQ